MFENLTERLQRTFKNLRGQGKLTDEHLDAALAEIREALLEGDVNVGVADQLLANIKAKGLGTEVMLQLSPDQQVIKIVRDELLALLGKHAKPLFASRPPSVWMIVGLQGSGKTTTTGKLAKWLTQHGHRNVSTDVPARRRANSFTSRPVHWHRLAPPPETTSRWKLWRARLKKRSFPPAMWSLSTPRAACTLMMS
jgi:signal recognition particle subunit SRP54